MIVIGIDLSGPANHKDTVMVIFQLKNDRLIFKDMITDAADEMIISAIHSAALMDEVAVGMDAPLSYQDGGGDRPQDKNIRQFIKGFGLSGSSIMPPTLTKMVYLTLRGIGLTRRISAMKLLHQARLVEVHPGAAIGTRIGPEALHHALQYKKEAESRMAIFEWFQTIGFIGLPAEIPLVSHQIDACAAALAAWHWADPTKQPMWHWSTISSEHPFEFCC
jgi:predicted nuclease with RNAse H fold